MYSYLDFHFILHYLNSLIKYLPIRLKVNYKCAQLYIFHKGIIIISFFFYLGQ